MKRCAFQETDALLRAGGTGGHQLRSQVSPRAGVSLAEEHNLTAHLKIERSIVFPTVLARSLLVQPEVEELQSRIGHWGHRGFVQAKLVRAVLCMIKPFRCETE